MASLVFSLLVFLLILLLAVSVAASIGAVLLKISTLVVSGFRVPFGLAWRTSIVCWLAAVIVSVASLAVMWFLGVTFTYWLLQVSSWAISLMVSAFVLGVTLEHPERGLIGFGRGLLIAFVERVIGGGLVLAAFIFFGLPKSNSMDMVKLRAAYDEMLKTSIPKSPLTSPTPKSITTTEEAQKEAVRRYPELGVAGTKFNTEFVARYRRYQQERPGYFMDKLWPISLAEETDRSLGPK